MVGGGNARGHRVFVAGADTHRAEMYKQAWLKLDKRSGDLGVSDVMPGKIDKI
jgi:hypothetical protein